MAVSMNDPNPTLTPTLTLTLTPTPTLPTRCVPGCNMFVDFAEVKDTARYTFPTGPASESGSEQEPPPAR